MKSKILFFILGLILTACSTSMKEVERSNHWLREKNYSKAEEELLSLSQKDGDDQLLYLLNLGMVYHLAGEWDKSIQTLLKADSIAEIKDYASLTREAGSVLLSEGIVQYRGDDYEKVLIHIYLSLNFLMKKDLDGALVEARRVNEILQKFRDEAKRDYEQNSMAFYLGGLVWEANKDWDDAYIAYKDTYKLIKQNSFLQTDLLRLSKKASREEDYLDWKKKFANKSLKEKPTEDVGELVVIYQQGKGPVKKPHPSFSKIPKLFPVGTTAMRAEVEVDGKKTQTQVIYDLQDVAIRSLEEQYAKLIAKRAAGLVAKYAVASQISKKNEALGFMTWIGLNLIDQADLRQWSNLPEAFQVARMYLKPGKYSIKIRGLNYANQPTGESQEFQNVEILKNKMNFINWRSFD